MNRRADSAQKLSPRLLFAVVALLVFFQVASNALAQDRWLLIFENSSAMKKRMPAVGLELQKLFFTSMGGQMHSGDSLGVWTFDKTLHVGEFPLSTWQPEKADVTASNLVTFLNQRSFKGEVNFNVLQPILGEVVDASQRLTVLIFCEGQGEISWTPYTEAINQSLRQSYAERKKNNQPFVVLLRVQEGKYFGCSVNFPPGEINFPIFPALPEEVKPSAENRNFNPVATEPAKKIVPLDNSPLIIVGKSVVTNLADLPAALAEMKTNVPSAAKKIVVTNDFVITNAAPASTPSVTNSVTNSLPASLTTSPPISPLTAPPKTAPEAGYLILIVTGVLALMVALALGIFLFVQARYPRGSLITDSLNLPRTPPPKA